MINLIHEYIEELESRAKNTRFKRLLLIAEKIFGECRVKGSHHIFKTPWPGNPRVILQPGKGGAAKGYQVNQVLQALKKRRDQLS